MAAHFSSRLFKFIKDLEANNDRDWFHANKKRYEEVVKTPLLQFIADFAPRLAKVSTAFNADPRPSGGSMFRIYRDTRFSKDKAPYKTFAAAQFRHKKGKDVHAPGFYLHLQPGECFMGAGCWHPDGPTITAIRNAIVADPARWKRLVNGKAFQERFAREGESLKRPPRGFDAEHPLVEDLKRKDHILVARFTQKEVLSADFLSLFAKTCRSAAPFMKFLAEAIGVEF